MAKRRRRGEGGPHKRKQVARRSGTTGGRVLRGVDTPTGLHPRNERRATATKRETTFDTHNHWHRPRRHGARAKKPASEGYSPRARVEALPPKKTRAVWRADWEGPPTAAQVRMFQSEETGWYSRGNGGAHIHPCHDSGNRAPEIDISFTVG